MLLGILSDTHEHLEHTKKAVHLFKDRGVAYAIHLGDYCAGPTVRALEGIKVVGILGNNDGDVYRLQRGFEQIGGDLRGEQFRVLEEDSLRIACYHGTIPEITDALIVSGAYDVLLYGHTHDVDQRREGATLVLNPGSAHGFEKQGTIALFNTQTKGLEIIEL